MTVASLTNSPALEFTPYNIDQVGSIGFFFASAPKRSKCGIYVLHFANDQRYVGKTVDIVTRLAKHRRTWSDIVSFEFATCERRDLDRYERAMIRRFAVSHSLRNIALTHLPGGDEVEVVQLTNGETVELPWERVQRATALGAMPAPAAEPSPRFEVLRARQDYPAIRHLIARYVHETIAAPAGTVGRLWYLSAMPSTGRNKDFTTLFRLNCGGVEALRAIEDTRSSRVTVCINVAAHSRTGNEFRLSLHDFRFLLRFVEYGSTQAACIDCFGLDAAAEALTRGSVLDAAYQFNTELMRKGDRKLARFHNAAFAADVVAEAARMAAEPALQLTPEPDLYGASRRAARPRSRRARNVIRKATKTLQP